MKERLEDVLDFQARLSGWEDLKANLNDMKDLIKSD